MAQVTPARDLGALLDALSAGKPFRRGQLVALSDLDREEAAVLRERWHGIPEEVRRLAMTTACELAEDNVDLEFTQFARIALHDRDPAVRRTAVDALWESSDRDAARDLVAVLRDDDDAVRAAAASSLGHFVLLREFDAIHAPLGDTIVDSLREAVTNAAEAAGVRGRALESLAPRRLPWVRTLITDAYFDDDQRLRLASIRAMGLTADTEWLEYLEDEAMSDDPAFRVCAANAFADIGAEEGIESLARLLADDDPEVVFAAITALGEIGGREATAQLEEFAEDAAPEYDEALAAAIESAQFVLEEGGSEL